jgi:alkylhydroperoxidase family enzyme
MRGSLKEAASGRQTEDPRLLSDLRGEHDPARGLHRSGARRCDAGSHRQRNRDTGTTGSPGQSEHVLIVARRRVAGCSTSSRLSCAFSDGPKLATMSDEIAELRAIVAAMSPAPEAMGPYLAKVRERAYTVTDAEVEQLKADGFSEDEIFEQTVAVAIAQGLRRYDAAMDVIG